MAASILARAERAGSVFVARYPTRPDGRFTVGLPAGSYSVWSEAPGFLPSPNQDVALLPGTVADVGMLFLGQAGRISGRVRTAEGQPPAGAQVVLSDGRRGFPAETDAQGRYILEGLVPRLYAVTVTAEGHASDMGQRVYVPAGEEVRRGFELASLTLTQGWVRLPDGQPAIEARVVVLDRQGDVVSGVPTDAEGRYQVPTRGDAASLAAAAQGLVAYAPLGRGQDESAPDLVLGQGLKISARVVDHAGDPLPGVWVRLAGPTVVAKPGAATDADGRVHFTGLVPARYRLFVRRATARSGRRSLEVLVRSGLPEQVIDMPALRGAPVRGRVSMADGAPAGGATVMVYSGRSRVERTLTDELGAFRFEALPPGDHRLFVIGADPGAQAVQRLSLGDGALEGLAVTLALAARVSGVVRGPGGDPLANVAIVVTEGYSEQQAHGRSDASGAYSLGPLPPGEYRLTGRLPERPELELRPVPFGVSAGQEAQVDVRLLERR